MSAAVFAAAPMALAESPRLAFGLGPQAVIAPSYPGADSYTARPGAIFQLQNLRLGGVTLSESDGWFDRDGTGFRGSLRVLSARKASDNPELQGLEDLSTALELGGGIYHKTREFQIYLDLRHGVTGHRGWVGEAGIDMFLRPVDGLTLAAGPRVGFADGGYMRQYFGVTGAESADSGLAAFTPGSGFHSAGVGLRAVYELNQDWAILGSVGYDRLIGDAGRSPIARQGSRDQFSVTLGVARVLRLH
ncbi:MipA/OmpV family protein [Rhabdonatronobacter sediminivivens]|nr:MipA/OmpV family protein [Rhabdonatronobacter sediminivivens]